MKLLPNQNLLDEESPLLKKLTPVALTIACRGFLAADSTSLVYGAAGSILLAPVGWIIDLMGKWLHLTIVFVIWWFVRGEIVALGVSEYVVLAVAITAVLYKELYDELVDLILNFLVLLTGGQFIRWMSFGYLSGDGARQLLLTRGPISRLVGVMVNVMPSDYRKQYDEIMDLYLDSNRPESAVRLNELLDKYSRQEADTSASAH